METTTAEGRTATRGQRRGFYWQDYYAAWTMLRCLREPDEGILQVEPEAAGAPHVDDLVVYRRDLVTYQQLKHKVGEQSKFTGSDLFGAPDSGGMSLLGKLYKGWMTVRGKSGLRVEVQLITNAAASAASNNLIVSPAAFARDIVAHARRPSWRPVGATANVLDELRGLTTAADVADFLQFLGDLRLEFNAPDENALREHITRQLRAHLRPLARAEVEAHAWAMHVYDLSTREHVGRFRGTISTAS